MAVAVLLQRALLIGPATLIPHPMAAAVKAPQRFTDDNSANSFRPSLDLPHIALPSVEEGLSERLPSLLQPKLEELEAARLAHRVEIAVGGHRGMGMNRKPDGAQHCTGAFWENTVKSFCEASSHGASFVEFDVQVTADGVPVIWHDDHAAVRAISRIHTCHMIKDLSVAEFKELHTQDLVRECPGSAQPVDWKCDESNHVLPTLDEVFRGVPESVGFDIEVKMTTPSSERRTPAAEVDRVVTAILREVREWEAVSYRRIVFSSFDPDVALELKRRQSSIPVLFLSDGRMDYGDHRRCGLATAVTVAFKYGLDGVVLEIAELAKTPSLVTKARQLGLHVMTYGVQNDNPDRVRQQEGWGVQAAIVDDVSGVVRGLARRAAALGKESASL